ncbi:MAG TPA: YihY/virulence factor BrkB family protein [Marmoricola sp.]|jgi:uncharacterized BrkB/YihY/UPF0761 family membrane protein|nr:YihY/virulence factor BrkB family protein [Marmoricola sp.]
MTGIVERADRFQRAHRSIGLPLGVIYKFFDDQGNYLAAIITYYAFVSIFPLLLIASSVLGFLLQGNQQLEHDVLHSALEQFPIVGTQLGKPEGIRGSTSAIVVGALAAVYGTMGLGQATQNALNTTLAIPRNSRLNPIASRVRSLILILAAGLSVLVLSVLTIVANHTAGFGLDLSTGLRWLLRVVAFAGTVGVLGAIAMISSSKRQTFREVLPGSVVVASLWQILQGIGGSYVNHVVTKADSLNSTFALVLGLVAFVYAGATVVVLGLEINVVLAERLYPRALLTPFTDAVDLTEADRRAYTRYAQAQRHKGFQRVHVDFDEPPP